MEPLKVEATDKLELLEVEATEVTEPSKQAGNWFD